MKKLLAIVVITFGIIALVGTRSILQDRSQNPGVTPQATPDDASEKQAEDDGKQEDRWAFIEGLVNEGTFQEVGYGEGGTLPKVWITDTFLGLTQSEQNRLLEVVYAYYNIADDNFGIGDNVLMRDRLILIVDDGTVNGRRVAKYDPFDGVTID